uniref:hypothetical protein n=1 Tax=Alistipes putredinis TaxID=28117 RepID=UPI003FD817D1
IALYFNVIYVFIFACFRVLVYGVSILETPAPSTTGAGQSAAYMPGGCYTIREWTRDGDFLTFDPSTNKHYDFRK